MYLTNLHKSENNENETNTPEITINEDAKIEMLNEIRNELII